MANFDISNAEFNPNLRQLETTDKNHAYVFNNINEQLIKNDVYLNEQLENNATKTITKETNILNLENNVEGISNISIDGNTIDIAKNSITSDFYGKTQGDDLKNPNIMKYEVASNLILPTQGKEVNMDYKYVCELDGTKAAITHSNSGIIPQQLFSFNIVKTVERKLEISIGNNITEKVAWLKKNITKMTCDWYGYGNCPSGNKAYFIPYNSANSAWAIGWAHNITNTVSKLIINLELNSGSHSKYLDDNGFVHFLAYTDASDGTIPSAIYTDYINLEVQLNPILKSVGEDNKEIIVKSIGKNLFDISRMNEEKYGAGSSVLDNIINLSENSIETSNNNSTTRGKGYIAHVKPNVDYTISFDVVEGHGYFNISGDYNWHEQRINFQEKRKYSSVIRTSTGKFEFSLNVLNSSSNSIVKIKNIQLEEGTTATTYEPYKEDKVTINLKEPLRGLPNGVRDTINADGTITRRVGKVVLNGSEDWRYNGDDISIMNGYRMFYIKPPKEFKTDTPIVSSFGVGTYIITEVYKIKEGCINDKRTFYVSVNDSRVKTTDISEFKKWLQDNPITVYYELEEPVIETIGQPLTLQSYTNGILQVDTGVTPFTTVKYPSNLNSRIATIEEANVRMNDNLGGAWKTLLVLADNDLKHTNSANNFGGRNYLLNSSLSSLTSWNKRFQKTDENELHKVEIVSNVCHILNTNQDYVGVYQKPIDMDLRYDYALSFDVKCDKKADMLIGFSMTGITVHIEPTNGEWVRVKRYVGKPIRSTNDIILYAKEHSEIYIKNVKVEKGFISTDWSIAPEEILKRLTNLENK